MLQSTPNLKELKARNQFYKGDLLVYGMNKLFHGNGTFVFKDGSIFQGKWMFGAANGLGRLISVNEDIYEGSFRDMLYHGFGTLK